MFCDGRRTERSRGKQTARPIPASVRLRDVGVYLTLVLATRARDSVSLQITTEKVGQFYLDVLLSYGKLLSCSPRVKKETRRRVTVCETCWLLTFDTVRSCECEIGSDIKWRIVAYFSLLPRWETTDYRRIVSILLLPGYETLTTILQRFAPPPILPPVTPCSVRFPITMHATGTCHSSLKRLSLVLSKVAHCSERFVRYVKRRSD